MNYTFKTNVRKDGAINIRVANRTKLGITPGAPVTVSVDTESGVVTIMPDKSSRKQTKGETTFKVMSKR